MLMVSETIQKRFSQCLVSNAISINKAWCITEMVALLPRFLQEICVGSRGGRVAG